MLYWVNKGLIPFHQAPMYYLQKFESWIIDLNSNKLLLNGYVPDFGLWHLYIFILISS